MNEAAVNSKIITENKTKTRRFNWPRLFGYDFFISFKLGPPPIGAQSYASDLARRLRELDFTVFFSEEEAPPGAKLDDTLVNALHRSRILVVIANEGALVHSQWVRKEVEEFRRKHPKNLVIPINIARAIEQHGAQVEASRWLDPDGRIWLDETSKALEEGITSPEVVKRLAIAPRFTKANTWLRRVIAAVIVALAGLALAAGYEALDANRKFREATAMRLASEGGAMTSALKPGGSIRGLLQTLAAHRMIASANTDEALQAEFLKFRRQIIIREVPNAIDSLAFNPDSQGQRIVSGGHDGNLQVWDAQAGQPASNPWQGEGPISSIAFSADGCRIVSGNKAGRLQLWDAATKQLVGPDASAPPPWFNWRVAVSRDGSRFAWGREMGEIVLWDVSADKLIGNLKSKVILGAPLSMDFSPDGRHIAYYAYTGDIGLLDSLADKPGADPLAWKAHVGANADPNCHPESNFGVCSGVVTFSPSGSQLVSGSPDGTLRWWDASTGQAISETLKGHAAGVTSVVFSPDGRFIASGGNDASLRLWDANTRQIINQRDAAHTGPITSIAFSPDSKRFVSGSLDNTLRVWDASEDQPLGKPILAHINEVTDVAFSREGEPIVIGAQIRNMGDYPRQTFASSPNGLRFVSRSEDKKLWLWDAAANKPLAPLLTDNNVPVTSVVFSPNGALLASVQYTGAVLLWNAETGKALPPLVTDHQGYIKSIAFSWDGTLIATGGDDGTILLWHTATGKPLRQQIKGHDGSVRGLAFSPNGTRVVSASEDRTLRLWDVATGKLLLPPLTGHEAGVFSVAFSPDGRRIVSGGGIPYSVQNEQPRTDYSLRLWDAETGQPIGQPLLGHEHDVHGVAFSSDGKHVISASLDNTTRVWEVLEAWADQLCAKLERNMSLKEWRAWVSQDIKYLEQCPGLPVPPDEPEAVSTTEK